MESPDFSAFAASANKRTTIFTAWIDWPTASLQPDMSPEEYLLRITRARRWMATAELDALVVMNSHHGTHFTGETEPHEWHDRCPARATWYILTATEDHLWLNPGMSGEHFSSARQKSRVTHLHAMVERGETTDRMEVWDVRQLALAISDLGLGKSKLGFELGDCTSLGMSYLDFERLRALLPGAEFLDGAPILRRCLQIQTEEQIANTRIACTAAVAMHDVLPSLVYVGMTEREMVRVLENHFRATFATVEGLSYRGEGGWDIRNPVTQTWIPFHARATDHKIAFGDFLARSTGGTSCNGCPGDVDRSFHVGQPSDPVRRYYDGAVACLRAMREAIRPGNRCSEVFAAYAQCAEKVGWPVRTVGRQGHGLFNGGGISVHPDCHLVLEPGMIISCEPVLGNEHGLFDVEDQFVVTRAGNETLHRPIGDELPIVAS